MRDEFRLHEREMAFRMDPKEAIAHSRMAIARADQYPPLPVTHIDLLLSQFGDEIHWLSFYCRAPKNADVKASYLNDIAHYAVQVHTLTLEKCTAKDLALWSEPSHSVEVLRLNSTQFADGERCELGAMFPNVRELTVEAIGHGSLRCIIDHLRRLEHFELVDQRASQPSHSDEIRDFLHQNRQVKSVSLRGGRFNLTALADSLSEAETLRLYVTDDDAFRAKPAAVPQVLSPSTVSGESDADAHDRPEPVPSPTVPHLVSPRSLTIESDAGAHDRPDQLPYTFEQLTEFTLIRQRISDEWCRVIGSLAGLTHLHLPAGPLSAPQLERLIGDLPDLEVLSILSSREVQQAAVAAMNAHAKLREVSFVGLPMSDVLQRKVILRQVNEQWTTVHDESTDDGITRIERVIEPPDSEEDEGGHGQEESGEVEGGGNGGDAGAGGDGAPDENGNAGGDDDANPGVDGNAGGEDEGAPGGGGEGTPGVEGNAGSGSEGGEVEGGGNGGNAGGEGDGAPDEDGNAGGDDEANPDVDGNAGTEGDVSPGSDVEGGANPAH